MRSGVVSSLLIVLPTSRMFTSGYVNMETILHFSYKITNERGTKTMFAYAHVKWFYGQSEHMYYLNYFIMKVFKKNFSSTWKLSMYLLISQATVKKHNIIILIIMKMIEIVIVIIKRGSSLKASQFFYPQGSNDD